MALEDKNEVTYTSRSSCDDCDDDNDDDESSIVSKLLLKYKSLLSKKKYYKHELNSLTKKLEDFKSLASLALDSTSLEKSFLKLSNSLDKLDYSCL